ncbi:hypothetical protein LINPERHAP2_LOCUS25075 [Linum perenne]
METELRARLLSGQYHPRMDSSTGHTAGKL